MANKVKSKERHRTDAAPTASIVQPHHKPFSFTSFTFQAIILALLGIIFYANTFRHELAFDDRMAISANEYVQRGVAGIPDILTHDSYQSYLEQRGSGNQLSGGRYRPLSLVTFAMEQQFLGIVDENNTDARDTIIAQQMHARHVINVLLYILSVIVLLRFFRQIIFPAQPLIAFVAALLFLIHPLHTEVVANVKSRDEILSVLFITLTFISAFKYQATKKVTSLVYACVYFFLALLSKEYAVVLLALLPLSFYLFLRHSTTASIRSVLPFLIPLVLYLLMRFAATSGPAEGAEQNIMNDPYLYATLQQRIATQILVLLYYAKLLFFPHSLAADYSYNQVAYTGFGDPLVWCALLLYLSLIVLTVWLIRRRHVLAFALSFYLLPLLLVSNLIVNIGAPMGERLIYHSSVGFAIAIAWILVTVVQRIRTPAVSRGLLAAMLAAIVIFSGFKTISRNEDWKNDTTLFLADVQTVPNSALVNNNAAAACMVFAKREKGNRPAMEEWFMKAIHYFDKAIAVNPKYTNARLNRGLCYFNMGLPEKAFPDWDSVRRSAPADAKAAQYLGTLGKYYFSKGMAYGKANHPDSAAWAFRLGTLATPDAADMWYNLAYACYAAGKYNEAKQALDKTLQLAPGKESAKQLYAQIQARAAGPATGQK